MLWLIFLFKLRESKGVASFKWTFLVLHLFQCSYMYFFFKCVSLRVVKTQLSAGYEKLDYMHELDSILYTGAQDWLEEIRKKHQYMSAEKTGDVVYITEILITWECWKTIVISIIYILDERNQTKIWHFSLSLKLYILHLKQAYHTMYMSSSLIPNGM